MKNLSGRVKTLATFVAILLAATLIASFTSETSATPEPAITINPTSGPVGTEVMVNGTIDTLDGDFTIRWNGSFDVLVDRATGYNVYASFIIPQTVAAPFPGRDVLIELIDNNKTMDNIANTTFTLYTKYYVRALVPPLPSQLQEGETIDIWVNITGGEANTIYSANITVKEPSPASLTYWSTVSLTNTTDTGSGNGKTTYPSDFTVGAHTNYRGIYNLAINETLASGDFTVGLTNATEYHRFGVVGIRATGYSEASESAWVNITNLETGRVVYSKNVSAEGNAIETSWAVPSNASMGTYTVTLTNSSTPSTIKAVPDHQTFEVAKIPFHVQTVRLDGEALAGITVEVYEKTALVSTTTTGDDGLASFSVEGGNYSFNASLNLTPIPDAQSVPVGTLLNQTVKRNVTLTLLCWISSLRIVIDPPLPFTNITLTSPAQNLTSSSKTNVNGVARVRNVPTNISYTIEARGYGSLFNTTNVEKLPAERNATWINITLIRPTHTISIHVLDSKGNPLKNFEVAAYEWGGGLTKPVESKITDDLGNVVFQFKFGRYRIFVYNEDLTVVLNKTVLNLTQDQSITIECKIFNVDLSVIVKDHLGNPISNAVVEVKREGVVISPERTKKGIASFHNITGGESKVSVKASGRLYETRTLDLDETKVIRFKLEKVIIVAGYLLEVTQLIACISIGVTTAIFALALIYRRLKVRRVHGNKRKSL